MRSCQTCSVRRRSDPDEDLISVLYSLPVRQVEYSQGAVCSREAAGVGADGRPPVVFDDAAGGQRHAVELAVDGVGEAVLLVVGQNHLRDHVAGVEGALVVHALIAALLGLGEELVVGLGVRRPRPGQRWLSMASTPVPEREHNTSDRDWRCTSMMRLELPEPV